QKFLQGAAFWDDVPHQLAVWISAGSKPGWVELRSKHWTLLSKTPDHSYPDWRKVFPAPEREKTVVTFNARAKRQLLEAIPQMPGWQERGEPVTLAVKNDEFVLRACNHRAANV